MSMSGCSDEQWFLRVNEAQALPWTKTGVGSFVWWETAPVEVPGRRAVVIWLHALGRVTWWISNGHATLALGYLVSVEEPDAELIGYAKRAAERSWAELDR
jgi:hypothetical protein